MRPLVDLCHEVGEIDGLRVRPWTLVDAAQLVAAWGDAEVARWNPVPPDPSLAFAEAWIAGAATQTSDSTGIDVVAVDGDATDVVLGEVGLQIDRERGLAEVGLWVAASARGRGVGTTLLAMAERFAPLFDVALVVGMVERDNVAAVRTFTSAGWQELPTRSDRAAFGFRVP